MSTGRASWFNQTVISPKQRLSSEIPATAISKCTKATIVLMVFFSSRISPLTSTMILRERSPRATAVVTSVGPVACGTRHEHSSLELAFLADRPADSRSFRVETQPLLDVSTVRDCTARQDAEPGRCQSTNWNCWEPTHVPLGVASHMPRDGRFWPELQLLPPHRSRRQHTARTYFQFARSHNLTLFCC